MGGNRTAKREPIAVVGMSTLFPQSVGTAAFWRNIVAGKDLLEPVPATHWLIEDYYDADPNAEDKTYGKRGGFLPEVNFDPLYWGVPPAITEATDVTQLLALMVTKSCLEDVRGHSLNQRDPARDFADFDFSKTSVVLGVTSAQKLLGHMTSRLQRPIWINAMREAGLPESQVQRLAQRIADHYVPWQESTFPGLLGNVVAGRVANRFNFGGTNCVTDAACASAFSALSMAVNELYLGDSDLVLCGGADTMNDIFMHMCFSKTPALSASGDVRPFSDKADGTLLGEGVAIFALRRLSDAERDGNHIYAVIKGVGSSSDGRSKSVYAPLSEGQAAAITRAYDNAGFDPKTIDLVEAHGTGTKAGDVAEFGGLCLAFDGDNVRRQQTALGSVKAQIGHSKATAGAAGLFKAVMALHNGVIPPTIKVDAPNPKLDISDSPFYLNTTAKPWIKDARHPRRAGVSSFGFGGSNFHVALEEYRGPNRALRPRALSHELIVLAAASHSELLEELEAIQTLCTQTSLAYVAWSTQQQFSQRQHAGNAHFRLALVAESLDDVVEQLVAAKRKLKESESPSFSTPNGMFFSSESTDVPGKIAFLFPGQGSQYVGMGSELAQSYDCARHVWDRCAAIDFAGHRLHDRVFPPTAFSEAERNQQQSELTKTQWAQPAIGAASAATLSLLSELGLTPQAAAGHSYGEVTALYSAGVLGLEQFLNVSCERGQLMNEAAKLPGAMTAVKSSAKKLQLILDECSEPVVLANINSPRQTVLSGPTEALERVEILLQTKGILFQRLGVATAFHSSVVAGSVAPFKSFLEAIDFAAPQFPVFANSTAQPYPSESAEQRRVLSEQIASPVRFVEQIEHMYEDGVRIFIEIGPKSVLSRLTKTILKRKNIHSIHTDRPGKSDLFAVLSALAQLTSIGVPLDFSALWAGYNLPVDDRLGHKPKLMLSFNGANINKPYPPKDGAAGRAQPNPEPPPAVETVALERRIRAELEQEYRLSKPAQAPRPESNNTSPETNQQSVSQQKLRAAAASAQSTRRSPMSSSIDPQWLAAFQAAQQSTAAAHTAYQQAMSSAHMAYLQAAQSGLAGLAALAGAPVAAAPSAPPSTNQTVNTTNTNIAINAVSELNFEPPQSAPVSSPVNQLEAPAAVSLLERPVSPPASDLLQQRTSQQVSPSSAAPIGAASSLDISGLLLAVVADKTGYPAEALEPSMTLEGDLGIDSIKRVEILSEMQERAPGLPEVDAASMAKLQTLQEIIEHLGVDTAVSSGSRHTARLPETPIVLETVVDSSLNLQGLLLAVVAEKTGYPAEALELSMTLEGDLGIDSIKRVEILSAMQEQAPQLPDVDAAAMAKLQTLQEIVSQLRGESEVNFH